MSRRRLRLTMLGVAALALGLDGRAADPGPPFALSSPLPGKLPATASFGEFRSTHLHAGLDFSTGGELGWPVRAAAAGEIFRLKVERRGYGRAVYVRHAGGYVTVYGHLHSFEDEALGLERFLAGQRAARGTRFPGDLYPEPPIPVRAGQVLALSGETGGGPPHLHFELRRGDEPVDPVRHGGLRPGGFAAPVLEALWILPRGPSRVDGRWGPVRLPFRRQGRRHFLDGRPAVEGRFDLALTAHVPGAGVMGLAGLELRCDGEFLFSAALRRFSFEQYRQSGLLYDTARTGGSPPRYTYRLRASAGMDLPGVEGAWLREPAQGDHACTLAAEDATGRRSEAEFTLEVLPSPAYDDRLPDAVGSYELFERLLLVNGAIALDPLRLPEAAARLPGFPQVRFPGRRGVTARGPGGVELVVPPGAAYAAAPLALSAAPAAPAPEAGLELLGPPFRLAPDGLFLRREATLRAPVADPAGAALYRLDRDGRWAALGGEPRAGRLEARTRAGGTYAVLRDRSAPRILGVQIREERRLGARRLIFPVEEVGQGIDVESFSLRIDDEAVEALYDPDRGWGEFWIPAGLKGRRSVLASCRDRAGNLSSAFRASVDL